MRKIILPLVIILLLVAGLGISWFMMQRQTRGYSENSAFKAIPLRTPLVIELSGLDVLTQKMMADNPLMNATKEFPWLDGFLTDAEAIRTILSEHQELKKLLAGKRVLAAFNPEGKNEIGCLFVLSLTNRAEKSEMISFAEHYAESKGGTLNRRTYDNVEIYRFRKGDEEFTFAESEGIFMCSRNALFVEEAIRQIPAAGFSDQEQFTRLYHTTGSTSDFNIFVNHEKIHQVLNKAVSPAFRNALQLFAGFGDYTELDVSLKEKEVLLGGFSFADQNQYRYLNVFRGQEADRFGLAQLIPSTASSFLALNLSDFGRYQSGYNEFLKGKQGDYYRREAGLKELGRSNGKAFLQAFQEVAGQEFAMVFGTVTQNEPTANRFFIAGVKSQSMARDLLIPLIESYAKAEKTSLSRLQTAYQLSDRQRILIYPFPRSGFPELIMGEPFGAVSARYVCFYDNYLIFCDNLTALKNYLHDLQLGDTLEKDPQFRNFSQQMAPKSTFWFYLNFSRGFYLKNHYLNEAVSNVIQNNEEAVRKFYALGWQFSASSGEFLNNLYLRYEPEQKEEPQAIWQAMLDSAAVIRPQLVVNHRDKANMEAIVQDGRNNLCLINKEGVTLWKVQLKDKIMGRIHQIDYYRNGKLQYLFNTRDQLYLIDRNGENVAAFPIRIKGGASNGVAVVDYDGSRDYRYFVATEDRQVHALDRTGKAVSGWKFEGTEGVVTKTIQYYRQGTKDFLVCSDRYMTYLLDRQGSIRVKISDKFEHSGNELWLTDGNALATTDADGKVHLQYFDGKAETISLGTFGKGHFFRADDLNGDKKTDYLIADGKRLYAFSNQGKKIYEKEFSQPVSWLPEVFDFGSGSKKVGIVCAGENRIYLLDARGAIASGFPLQGGTPFTIGRLSSGTPYFNLLVGSEDNSFFNYKIE